LCHPQGARSQYLAKLHSMSNADVGNTIYNLKLFHIGFMLLKYQCLKTLKYLNCPIYNKMGKNRLLNYTIIVLTKCTSLLKAQDIIICTFLSLHS
jgi:hypothetical protein